MDTMIFYVGIVGITGAFVCSLIIITIAFPKVRKIEKIISAATLAPSSGRNIWGEDPIGRLMRTSHVFAFLSMRNVPGHFRRAASNVGDVNAKIPFPLFLWAYLPTLGLFVFGGAAFFVGLTVD